jgi:hypothetical protein
MLDFAHGCPSTRIKGGLYGQTRPPEQVKARDIWLAKLDAARGDRAIAKAYNQTGTVRRLRTC